MPYYRFILFELLYYISKYVYWGALSSNRKDFEIKEYDLSFFENTKKENFSRRLIMKKCCKDNGTTPSNPKTGNTQNHISSKAGMKDPAAK